MAFTKAALCASLHFFEKLPAFSKLQGDRFAQDCILSQAVWSPSVEMWAALKTALLVKESPTS
jgi:hypothetical protein